MDYMKMSATDFARMQHKRTHTVHFYLGVAGWLAAILHTLLH